MSPATTGNSWPILAVEILSVCTEMGAGERAIVGEAGETLEAIEDRRDVLSELEAGDRTEFPPIEDCVTWSIDSRTSVVRNNSCIARMVM